MWRSNSKNRSIEERPPKIQRFHKSLRGLIKNPAPSSRGSNGAGAGGVSADAPSGAGKSGGAGSGGANGERHTHADEKYGRFPLDRRANVDQVRTRLQFFDLYVVSCTCFICIESYSLYRSTSVCPLCSAFFWHFRAIQILAVDPIRISYWYRATPLWTDGF